MREPHADAPDFALLAEFDEPEKLLEAVARTRAEGFVSLDACSPFPIEGMEKALGLKDNRGAWATLAGGIAGALTGYYMQVYTNYDFPINVGGRSLVATPAFMLITFELTVLFAVLSGIGMTLFLNRLPRLHHPLFDNDTFRRATSDRFFLVLFGNDPKFHPDGSYRFLNSLSPVSLSRVGPAEEPE